MKRFVFLMERLNWALGGLSGLCVASGSFLIITEITSRLLLHKSLLITDEYTGYLMAVSSFLGLGYVELKNGHIRMDLIDLLKNRYPKIVAFFRIFAYIVAALFALYLTYVGWKLFYQSNLYGSRSMQISETPLAIPQFFVPIGGFALFLQYVCNLYNYCSGLTSK